jgi:ribosomal protein S18 acetylase RimI-like enzyme
MRLTCVLLDACVLRGTQLSNVAALRLYERLGFAREERLVKYYLNGGDAFRLKLWLPQEDKAEAEVEALARSMGGVEVRAPEPASR